MKAYKSEEFGYVITVLKVCKKSLLVDKRATTESNLKFCYKYGINLGVQYMLKKDFAMLYKSYRFKPYKQN